MELKKKRTESINFANSVFTLVAGALAAQGIAIDAGTGQAVADAFGAGDFVAIALIVSNLIPIFFKIYNKAVGGAWSWDFVKSANFITQAVTAVLAGLLAFTAIPEVWIIVALEIVNAINVGWHFHKDGVK